MNEENKLLTIFAKYLFSPLRKNPSSIFLLIFLYALAFLGIRLSHSISTNLWIADAESAAHSWIESVEQVPGGLSALLQGAPLSERSNDLLNDASLFGDVYRYRVWDKAGNLKFTAERVSSTKAPDHQRILNVLQTGKPFTEISSGSIPDNPESFILLYAPIKRDHIVAGVIEVYLDQTPYEPNYRRYAAIRERVITTAIVIAGGIPVFLFLRKLRDYHYSRQHAHFIANHDALTGFPNRQRFEDIAREELKRASHDQEHTAILLVNLDRFNFINDSFGHGVGDLLLKQAAQRLQSSIREGDVIARFGNDEFIILQLGQDQPASAESFANRLLDELKKEYVISELRIVCTASIGIAIAPRDGQQWGALLTRADIALNRAKRRGNCIRLFEQSMEIAVRERQTIETHLRRALEVHAFELAYQPIVDLKSKRTLGYETLLRWPSGWESRSPIDFIPVAEENGLIVPIGAWALENACRTAASWPSPLKVAVNLSPIQFRDNNIVATVERALRSSHLEPSRLELEITEGLLLHNTEAVLDQLMKLREMGISISLDDFGTGYSSLGYLTKFPFHTVKIDRSFVANMNSDEKSRSIVKTIIAMAKSLGLTVLAEGIETEEQAELLTRDGCDQGQGFLFGLPVHSARIKIV